MPEKPMVPIGNSNKSKENNARKTQRMEPIAKGSLKKPGFGRWFTEIFLGDSVHNLNQSILLDVIVPSIKDILLDAVGVYLGGRPRKNTNGSTVKIDYNGYSNRRVVNKTAVQRPSNTKPGVDDVVLGSKQAVQGVIDQLADIIDQYECATMGQFYDLVELQQYADWTDDDYGWTSVAGACPVKVRGGGWGFSLPDVVYLNKEV